LHNSIVTGVMCSNLLAPVVKRAAAFCIISILCKSWLLTPTSTLLQESSRVVMKACTSVFIASGVRDLSNEPELSQVEEAGSAECSNVVTHAQLTINQNTQDR